LTGNFTCASIGLSDVILPIKRLMGTQASRQVGPSTLGRVDARRGPRSRRYALSLVEALFAAIILTVVVAAVSQALLAGQMQSYDAAHRARAIELAEALMEEIVRLPYEDPDSDGELSRATFDDLDDFDGYSDTGTLSDIAGTAYSSEYNVFTRTVTVTSDSETIAAFGTAISGLDITVTVEDAAGSTWTLRQFVPEPAS